LTVYSLQIVGEKKKRGKEFNTEFTEGPQRTRRKVQNGNSVVLDRMSPPLQIKGGAPSSSFVG